MDMLQKRDMILATAILLMAVTTLGVSHYTRRASATIAWASLDGIVVKTLDLSKDMEIAVISPNGGTSRLIAKDGRIRCSEASYPDKVCVYQEKRHLNSDTIVCLPDQIIVIITGGE